MVGVSAWLKLEQIGAEVGSLACPLTKKGAVVEDSFFWEGQGGGERGVGSAVMVSLALLCLICPIDARNIARSSERMWSWNAACEKEGNAWFTVGTPRQRAPRDKPKQAVLTAHYSYLSWEMYSFWYWPEVPI